MNIENENMEQVDPRLHTGDLAIAAYALAEVFNSFLVMYENEEYEEMSKEEIETTMNQIRTTFIKFNTLNHFRGQRNNLHKAFRPKFSCNRTKNSCTDGLQLCVKQNGRIIIKLD